MISLLLPTKARNMKRRVSEILNEDYRQKYSIELGTIKGYSEYPTIETKNHFNWGLRDKPVVETVRELNGGLEAVTHNMRNGDKPFVFVARLIDEEKKRTITFSYPLSAKEVQFDF